MYVYTHYTFKSQMIQISDWQLYFSIFLQYIKLVNHYDKIFNTLFSIWVENQTPLGDF